MSVSIIVLIDKDRTILISLWRMQLPLHFITTIQITDCHSSSDEQISGSKIQSMDSEVQIQRDDSQGVVGFDDTIDQARIDPVGGQGMHHHDYTPPRRAEY